MKSNKIALTALLLWVITIAVFAWFFVRGNTTAGTDNRTAIVLQSGEREMVLSEMRSLLSAVQGILDAANNGDAKRIAQLSRSVGTAMAADDTPSLMTKLPLAFKTLGMSLHRDMDEIADAADGGKPVPELLKMAANTLTKCVACHAAWQIKAGN